MKHVTSLASPPSPPPYLVVRNSGFKRGNGAELLIRIDTDIFRNTRDGGREGARSEEAVGGEVREGEAL